jgi:hypothetical protein
MAGLQVPIIAAFKYASKELECYPLTHHAVDQVGAGGGDKKGGGGGRGLCYSMGFRAGQYGSVAYEF